MGSVPYKWPGGDCWLIVFLGTNLVPRSLIDEGDKRSGNRIICAAISLLFFTNNLYNFTFSLAARSCEERRTAACGL